MKKVLKLTLLVVVAAIGVGIFFLNSALITGSGYSSKYLCSQVFLANRDPDIVFKNDVLPTHPLFRFITNTVDKNNKTVTATAFGFFIKNDGIWNGIRILPKGWVQYSLTPTPKAPKGEYGAQFWLNAGGKNSPKDRMFPSLPKDMAYLCGFNFQIVAIIPSRDVVIVRLGATHDDSWSHESFITNVLACIKE